MNTKNTEKFEEDLKYYHIKDECGWSYYFKIHNFKTRFGKQDLVHSHKIYISDNQRLESYINRSWGSSEIPDLLKRHTSGRLSSKEKAEEINKDLFDSVYDRVLQFINNKENWE